MGLSVVYATDTGHVLGAVASVGAAGPAPAAEDLVGKELPLPVTLADGKVASMAFPLSLLAVAAVDDQPAALVVPWAFGVDVVGGKPKPALAALAPFQDGGGPLGPVPGGVTVTAASGGVTVALPAPASTGLAVLAMVASATTSRGPLSGTVGSGQAAVSFPMPLDVGAQYGVLVLVAGWRGWVNRVTVS
jgi:hypothetical protein